MIRCKTRQGVAMSVCVCVSFFKIGLPLFACVRPSPPRIPPSVRMMSRGAFSEGRVKTYSHFGFLFKQITKIK